jgi:hypothetical protein
MKKGYHQEVADTQQYKNTGQTLILIPEMSGKIF